MDKLSPAVLEAFGVNSRRIKREKGRYLCDTACGTMNVHITSEPPEAIRLQHYIKEYLAERGFPWTDQYQLANTGQPFVLLGRDTYVMTKYPHERRELDFENEAEVIKAFETLALFHIAACDIARQTAPHFSSYIPQSPPKPEIYLRQISELAQAGKQARRGPRLSDFDVLFIKHAPRYGEIMQSSISLLAGTGYAKLYSEAINRGSLCHNAIKEENILSGTHIINFSKVEIDLQLSDLTALIHRYAQRSSKNIPVRRLLEAYDAVNPLPAGAEDILYALLIFPWAFVKIITQYYSKKRNWTPNGLINRMDAILSERESYEKYVNAVAPYDAKRINAC